MSFEQYPNRQYFFFLRKKEAEEVGGRVGEHVFFLLTVET